MTLKCMLFLKEMYTNLYPSSLYELVKPARFYEEGKQVVYRARPFFARQPLPTLSHTRKRV